MNLAIAFLLFLIGTTAVQAAAGPALLAPLCKATATARYNIAPDDRNFISISAAIVQEADGKVICSVTEARQQQTSVVLFCRAHQKVAINGPWATDQYKSVYLHLLQLNSSVLLAGEGTSGGRPHRVPFTVLKYKSEEFFCP